MGNALPTSSTPAPGTEPAAPATPPATFDEWLAAAPDDVKSLASSHAAGLKTALESERTQRKELARQLADLSKAATEGSEAKKQLGELSNKLTQLERRDAFSDVALKAGVDPKSLKLAFIAANDDGLISDKGKVDIDTLKASYPQLFTQAPAKPTAPAATVAGGASGGAILDMNGAIRRSAGRA